MDRREFLRMTALAGAVGAGRGVMPAHRVWAAEEAAGGEPLIQLNWNENPLGLSPAARQAVLDTLAAANRYPDAHRDRFVEALALRHGVTTDQVVLGNGSTEILQMIVQAAESPRASLVLADPTFEAMSRYQRPLAYEVVRVPLDSRYAHDVQRMRELVASSSRPTVVYVCNPNNPTGTLTPDDELAAWVEAAPETVLFVFDEAYYEYVEAPGFQSARRWIDDRVNVVVVRTFSKIYAMAGMRLGYALAHPHTAARLAEFMSSDNANVLALAAGLAALNDNGLLVRSRAANHRSREIVHACLDELGLESLPSHASFLMHEIPGDLDRYIQRMREHGIRVGRRFPPMPGHNRLSMGLPEEMERFVEVLRDFRRRGWV